LNNIFVLKIAVELYKTNILNLEQFFYKEIRSVVKTEKICALKLLIATDLNIYRLFLEKLLVTVVIIYGKSEVIELLIKEYSVTLELYSIYTVI